MCSSGRAFVVVFLGWLLASTTTLMTAKPRQPDRRLDGVWRLTNAEGKLAAVLTVKDGVARRGHCPGECRIEFDGDRALLSWPDGFRDVIAADDMGTVKWLALPRWTKCWKDAPRFELIAFRSEDTQR